MKMEKQVGIIGAGISGLMACKHLIEKGIKPVVFESNGQIGGIWCSQTLESTKLQTPKKYYQFSDFPWPFSVKESFPNHTQVLEYLNSYASHFKLLPFIKFNAKVIGIDYVCAVDQGAKEMDPSSSAWKWNVFFQDSSHNCSIPKVYQVDFVIVCIGKYSDVPYVPEFAMKQGPEIFNGKVLHSMDYAAMDDDQAFKLIKNKTVTVVGFQKSAVDVTAEIARKNGVTFPCTLVYKTVHWMVSESFIQFSFQLLNRFGELMIHKPNEGFILSTFASLLSPLMWVYSKSVETYLKWTYPLKKYNMVPNHSFLKQIASCMFTILPNDFYKMVKEGSLLLRRSQSIRFSENGLIVDGKEVPSEVVIFATGYRSEEKLKGIFRSTEFQSLITGSSAPFYRECVHPRIPQLAILGYSDSPSIMFTTEMRSKWLAHFLAGNFKLPNTTEMEEDTSNWQKCMIQYTGDNGYKRFCVSVLLQIYSNDQLCKDMGYNPRRKKWILPELFSPYAPDDYANLGKCQSNGVLTGHRTQDID